MVRPDLIEPVGPEEDRLPRWVWRDGVQYYSLPELARLRKISRWGASKWARSPRRREGQTIEVDGHVYAAYP